MTQPPAKHAPIGITMGDPAGIGPEIILKLWADLSAQVPASADGIVVLGDVDCLTRAAQACGISAPLTIVTEADLSHSGGNNGIRVLQACRLSAPPVLGAISREAGQAAYDCLLTGIDLARRGLLSALVTAPIHKEALKLAGVSEPGHTEILARETATEHFGMMLANDELRVMLVSIHVSLTEAIAAVTRASVLRAIALADQGTRAFGVEKPRIAVAGLNPHAGEGGLFGREEIEIIAPAIEEARKGGLDASGPFAPDTIFMRARRGEFDCVVAMYHDQGLIPVKYLGIDHGVNVTVGLPFPRTSVDHGTAFDLAGTGRASAQSLIYAFKVASRMVTTR